MLLKLLGHQVIPKITNQNLDIFFYQTLLIDKIPIKGFSSKENETVYDQCMKEKNVFSHHQGIYIYARTQ